MATRDDVVVVEQRPRRRSGLRILLGLILLLVLVAAVILVVLALKESDDAKDDVSIRTCEPGTDGGEPTAGGTIQNSTSEDSNYTIRVEFQDPQGNTLSQGGTTVNDVGADSIAEWELTGVQSAEGEVRCEVVGASRIHIPGQ